MSTKPGKLQLQSEILQHAADLVLQIALDLDQLGPAFQESSRCLAVRALHLYFYAPASVHDPRHTQSVAAATLVDLHRQDRLRVPRIDLDDRQAEKHPVR